MSRHRQGVPSLVFLFVWSVVSITTLAKQEDEKDSPQKPNVLIIMADQLNWRTLGGYRNHLSQDQAFVWGNGVAVETPFLDSLAAQGILFTNFYTVSPTCTPSRAAFLTGCYPPATGAYANNKPLMDNVTTLAHILQQQGYFTAYLGKWHLYGEAAPGWGHSHNNTFGFSNVTFQYNRGGASKVFLPKQHHHHNQDSFMDMDMGPFYDMYSFKEYIPSLNNTTGQDVANSENYLTDFLVQKTMDLITEHNNQTPFAPFAIMLSIPDPHPPYTVRKPYDSLYQNVQFEIPRTMEQTLRNDPQAPPKWAHANNSTIQDLTRLFTNQNALRQYFGMIKCLDDNLGKLFSFIQSYYNNTLIVFTSDHGGLLGEHSLQNKGKPYKTSAGVPFIVQYPRLIPSGTVIHTPTANIDFLPTILSILNISKHPPHIHGQDLSLEWIQGSSSNRTIYLISPEKDWVAAVDSNYKLVLSTKDQPWLFDLVKDPDEMKNYYKDPLYHTIAVDMRQKLLTHIQQYIPSHIFDPDKAQDDLALD